MSIASTKVRRPEAPASRPAELDLREFPDQPAGAAAGPPATVENVRLMLDRNGISSRYNMIKKRTEITVPWRTGMAENSDASAMTHVLGLAAKYGMPTGLVPAIVEAIGDENSFNPAADWINSRAWDGEDRLRAFCDTITPREGYPLELRDVLILKWLIGATAAARTKPGFKSRGVLTLQGPQGLGKTSWVLQLINDEQLRSKLIKVDHHMDPNNKDSLLGVIDHFIVELGELDSSFKRGISRLKGFITAPTDKVRRPYARVTAEYPRTTVFAATVNEDKFLVDDTGNSRWWTIPCEAIDYQHGIDMQQVFAQCAVLVDDGAVWWLDAAEERVLERQNSLHRSFSIVRDALAGAVDIEATDTSGCPAHTASEVLVLAGIAHPTNPQAKECGSYLREWFGPSKRHTGRDVWRVPFRPAAAVEGTHRLAPVSNSTKSKFD